MFIVYLIFKYFDEINVDIKTLELNGWYINLDQYVPEKHSKDKSALEDISIYKLSHIMVYCAVRHPAEASWFVIYIAQH